MANSKVTVPILASRLKGLSSLGTQKGALLLKPRQEGQFSALGFSFQYPSLLWKFPLYSDLRQCW